MTVQCKGLIRKQGSDVSYPYIMFVMAGRTVTHGDADRKRANTGGDPVPCVR